jgi:hypothetical protein
LVNLSAVEQTADRHLGYRRPMTSGDGTPGKRPLSPRARRQPVVLLLRRMCIQACIEGTHSDIWDENDYVMVNLDTNRCVGRIYPEMIRGEPRWLWFLQTKSKLPPNSGVADTLEEAKAQFKRSYAEVKGRT